jgi:polysaccharide export outer membrane protein
MKASRVILAVLSCGAIGAQTVLMNGSATQNHVGFSYETRLEPPTPPFAGGFIGGVVTDDKGIHRYMAYRSLHKFFGYDLQVEQEGGEDGYKVTFQPLSIGPARVELPDPESWTIVPMATYPGPQSIHSGDSIALDLFTNAATGQKIVEYLHFPKAGEGGKAYRIAVNDMLYVSVAKGSDRSGVVEVKPDGFITVADLGEVKAAGLTTHELSEAITGELGSRNVNHPDVNVQVIRVNSKKFYIAGQVRRPGAYGLTTPKTVLEAIVEAGGPVEFAKTKAIYILRNRERLPFNYLDVSKGKFLEQNVQLQNGDIIVIP